MVDLREERVGCTLLGAEHGEGVSIIEVDGPLVIHEGNGWICHMDTCMN